MPSNGIRVHARVLVAIKLVKHPDTCYAVASFTRARLLQICTQFGSADPRAVVVQRRVLGGTCVGAGHLLARREVHTRENTCSQQQQLLLAPQL